MIGTNIDITERKRFEDEKLLFEHQFQQTQKLESLGVLSGGIAHDFNNILAIIKGNCALATMDPENTENYITEIDKASDRAAALCRQMLAYAGKAQLTKTQVNMLTLVDDMANMLKTTLQPPVWGTATKGHNEASANFCSGIESKTATTFKNARRFVCCQMVYTVSTPDIKLHRISANGNDRCNQRQQTLYVSGRAKMTHF